MKHRTYAAWLAATFMGALAVFAQGGDGLPPMQTTVISTGGTVDSLLASISKLSVSSVLAIIVYFLWKDKERERQAREEKEKQVVELLKANQDHLEKIVLDNTGCTALNNSLLTEVKALIGKQDRRGG